MNGYLLQLLSVGLIHIQSAYAAHCGLPPFLDELPSIEKKEVLAVWKDYKPGQDCAAQRRETQEIIDNLPSDIRAVVFGRPPMFLKNAAFAVRKMFRDIMHNRTLSHEQKKQQMTQLAQEVLSKSQLEDFHKYIEVHERMRTEFLQKVAKLSPAAKEYYEKLENLNEERNKLIEGMDEKVRKELRDLYRKPRKRAS